MFSPALGRVVRSTNSIASPVCSLGRPATLSAVRQTLSRPPPQRRLSSSKASIPPDGLKGPSSIEETTTSDTNKNTSKASTRKTSGRASKKRAAASPALNVPHVPPTDYLEESEVKISSFFSLHRPISITSAFPAVFSNASFDAIFQPRPATATSWKTMMDNVNTLSGGIERIEAALRSHEQKSDAEEVVQSEADIHLAMSPQISQATMDGIVSRWTPYKPPPVPMPIDQKIKSKPISKQQQEAAILAAAVRHRTWRVTVTESTDSEGTRTYVSTQRPMVEISVPTAEESQDSDAFEMPQRFLERMRQRQNTNTRYRGAMRRPDMLMISVKRQRKLKMKKHKYKKLMKRTRLLRRKLDRA